MKFNERKINIRPIKRSDLRNVKGFQDFINSLVKEEVKTSRNKEVSLREKKECLKSLLKNVKNKKEICLIAEDNGIIVATTSINLEKGRAEHVGNFRIDIRKGYRGLGLGKYLMAEILKLARKQLNPKPKIIYISVYSNNKPGISLYKKYKFKVVARIPKQFNYKGRLIDELVMLKFDKTSIMPIIDVKGR